MKAIDIIRWALQTSDEGTRNLVSDMRDVALTQPTGQGGNHPLWCLGHMAYIEGMIPKVLFGEPHPLEHWAPLFGTGTSPTADAAVYPSFDEVLAAYTNLRTRNLKLLDEIGEAGLDRVPPNIPPGFESVMKTVGHTFMLIALHQMVHYGQIADARRVAGRKPLV